jgi:hypothetical protein
MDKYQLIKTKIYTNKANNQHSIVLNKKNLKLLGIDLEKEKSELRLFIKRRQ